MYFINAGKLQTKFTRYTIPLILLIPIGFLQALELLVRIRPNIILSFGGYASFPVVFFGWLFRIPVILHEQTVGAGRASMASAFFVRKVALAREESKKYFPPTKSVVTGNPVAQEIISVIPKSQPANIKTILVMGGSRGSEFINEEIYKILPEILKRFKVIHITGERDYDKYKNNSFKNYQVFDFVSPSNIANLYNESDLIISRAGANSVSEILSVKRPAILIPLPRTFMNEQVKNAKYAENFGIASVMLEQDVNPKSLLDKINEIALRWQEIVNKVQNKASPDIGASERLVNLLEAYL